MLNHKTQDKSTKRQLKTKQEKRWNLKIQPKGFETYLHASNQQTAALTVMISNDHNLIYELEQELDYTTAEMQSSIQNTQSQRARRQPIRHVLEDIKIWLISKDGKPETYNDSQRHLQQKEKVRYDEKMDSL